METFLVKKSFTLIEILVVIVVIGILSAFILVGMSSITNSANIAKGQAFLNSMDNALLLSRVSQWKFDEAVGSTTTADSWGTNTGTLLGGATVPQFQTTGCVSGNCLLFDGIDDYVDLGNVITLAETTPFSVSMWAKSDEPVTEVGYTIMKYKDANNYISIYFREGQIRFYLKSGGVTIGGINELPYVEGVWYHTLMTYDGSYFRGYINGDLVGEYDASGIGAGTNDASFLLAKYSTNYAKCSLDDVRIYNQAIPISQINQNYYSGLNSLMVNNSIEKLEYFERLSQLKESLSKY